MLHHDCLELIAFRICASLQTLTSGSYPLPYQPQKIDLEVKKRDLN